MFSLEEPHDELPPPGKQGAPLKPWEELGNRQKRKQNQKAFNEVKKVAEARQIGTEQVVGGLLKRSNGEKRDFSYNLSLGLLIIKTRNLLLLVRR